MSLKQGKDVGVSVIKCQNREGTEQLKKLHYDVNDILFKWRGKYMFQADAEQVFTELCNAGKEINALVVPEKAAAKKMELLTALRNICTTLRGYCREEQTSEDLELMQKAINFWLHSFIEEKQKGAIPTEKIIELLTECSRLWCRTERWRDELNLGNFTKANAELLNILKQRYETKNPNYGDN